MRRRQTPKPIPPDNGLYFALDVPGRGLTHWRLPFPIYIARITELVRLASGHEGEKLDKATAVWVAGSAAIGFCWADPDHELTTRRGDFGSDLMAYGEAVLDELHEAGWSMGELGEVYPALVARLRAALTIAHDEVQERAGFSQARQDKAV